MLILCDNEPTVDIIKNKNMLTNIRPTNNPVEITGIGGTKIRVNHIGDLLGYGSVYFHPDVSENIISFHHLAKRFKSVSYNNRIKDAFIVTRDDNSMMDFVPSAEGLYHCDFNLSVKRRKELESLKKETTMMIQTVTGIKRIFLKKEIDNADKAQRLYVTVRRPSQKIFEEMIKRGKLFNANITTQDYRNALQIYGKDLGGIKGKATRKKLDHIPIVMFDQPKLKTLVLSVDIMYFTGLMFLTTVSQNVIFITASLLENRRKQTIVQKIQKVFNISKGKGHEVNNVEFLDTDDTPIHMLLADNEFHSLKEEIENDGVQVHVVSKNEHVPEVERQTEL
jgi:hypothetical protein